MAATLRKRVLWITVFAVGVNLSSAGRIGSLTKNGLLVAGDEGKRCENFHDPSKMM